MEQTSNRLGNWGEQRAAEYLEAHGFKILKKNFRLGQVGEIDLVADDHGTLVFVEVKTQSTDAMGEAMSWVTPKKQRQIGRVAQAYLTFNKIENRECRFDVLAVARRGNEVEIKHIPNAFWL